MEKAYTFVGLIKIINAKRPNIHIIFLVIFIVRCFMFCNLSFFFRFVYFLIGSSFSRTSFRENLFYFLIVFLSLSYTYELSKRFTDFKNFLFNLLRDRSHRENSALFVSFVAAGWIFAYALVSNLCSQATNRAEFSLWLLSL